MPLRYAECRRRGGRFCACLRSIFPCVGGRDGSGFPGVRSSHKKHPPGDRGGLYCFAGERRDLRSRVPCDCFFSAAWAMSLGRRKPWDRPPQSQTPIPRPARPHCFSCLALTGCEPLPGPARSEPGACHACGRPPVRPPARGAKRPRWRGVARGIDLTRLIQLHACFCAAVLMERASCAAVPTRGLCQPTRILPARPNASV